MRTNTKKTAMFLKSGTALPTAPANYLEVEEAIAVTPEIPIEEFKRINGRLGSNDSYADTHHSTITQTISHKMRYQNSAGDALDTLPEYSDLLKVGGFDEVVDTSTAGEETVIYSNTQAPVLGSAVFYIDGNKQTSTGSLATDLTFNFPIGKASTISASLSAFLDNKGIATSEATPDVSGVQSDEGCMIVGCSDIMTTGGTIINPDNISITMGADIQEFYGMGLKEFQMTDYVIKVVADFYPDNADYNSAVTKLVNQTTEAIEIKLGTNAGAMVNGKSVLITANTAKASAVSDSIDKDSLKRSFTWLLVGNTQLSIKHGFYS